MRKSFIFWIETPIENLMTYKDDKFDLHFVHHSSTSHHDYMRLSDPCQFIVYYNMFSSSHCSYPSSKLDQTPPRWKVIIEFCNISSVKKIFEFFQLTFAAITEFWPLDKSGTVLNIDFGDGRMSKILSVMTKSIGRWWKKRNSWEVPSEVFSLDCIAVAKNQLNTSNEAFLSPLILKYTKFQSICQLERKREKEKCLFIFSFPVYGHKVIHLLLTLLWANNQNFR